MSVEFNAMQSFQASPIVQSLQGQLQNVADGHLEEHQRAIRERSQKQAGQVVETHETEGQIIEEESEGSGGGGQGKGAEEETDENAQGKDTDKASDSKDHLDVIA